MTVEITLPDELAQKAQAEGLLAPESVEELFREKLREQAWQRLRQSMDAIAAVDTEPPMSMEEITEIVREVRREMAEAGTSVCE